MSVIYDKFDTYMASSSAVATVATATDVFTLTGSATKNIYILEMGISTTQGTSGINAWHILKRSAANTAGTSAAITSVPLQSNGVAATATPLQYTANPTAVGTELGSIWSGWVNSPKIDANSSGVLEVSVNFENLYGKPIALLSTSEVIAWNLGGKTVTGGSALAWFKWIETPKT